MLGKISRALNSNIVLLLLGFALTTMVGSYINDRYQQATWEREKRFAILFRRVDAGMKFVDELSDLMNRRFFLLRRLLWTAEKRDSTKFDQLWDEYYQTVIEWNQKLVGNWNRIKRLGGTENANMFLDWGDQDRPDDPASIHGRFKLAHDRTLAVRECLVSGCEDFDDRLRQDCTTLDHLDEVIDLFVIHLNDILIETEEKMQMRPSNKK